jgi:hypothetical protein
LGSSEVRRTNDKFVASQLDNVGQAESQASGSKSWPEKLRQNIGPASAALLEPRTDKAFTSELDRPSARDCSSEASALPNVRDKGKRLLSPEEVRQLKKWLKSIPIGEDGKPIEKQIILSEHYGKDNPGLPGGGRAAEVAEGAMICICGGPVCLAIWCCCCEEEHRGECTQIVFDAIGRGCQGFGGWGQRLCASGYNYTRENCVPSMRSMRDKILELCGGRRQRVVEYPRQPMQPVLPEQPMQRVLPEQQRRRIADAAERRRIANEAERQQRVMEMQLTRDNERPRQSQEAGIGGNSSRIGPSMPSERSGFRDNGIEQPVQPIERPAQQENQNTIENLMSEYEDNNRRNTRFVRDLYNNIREILRESPPENECLRRVRDLYRNKMNAALNIGLIRWQRLSMYQRVYT